MEGERLRKGEGVEEGRGKGKGKEGGKREGKEGGKGKSMISDMKGEFEGK